MDSYAWPSTVNVANFVTVKPCLEGDDERSNFKIWKKQMVCLLQGQDVLGFVDGEIPPPPPESDEQKLWRRTDGLVQGWILGSIGNDALHAVCEKPTARDIWLELDYIFKQEEEKEEQEAVEEEVVEEGKEEAVEEEDSNDESNKPDRDSEAGVHAAAADEDFSRYLPLYQAAQRGDWDAAMNFFGEDINEISSTIISSNSETALHVAVLTGQANNFVKKLVEMTPRETLALKDSNGETALHNAAIVGNTAAASALVKKNPDLLHISNDGERLAVVHAAGKCHKETLQYLISEHEANAEHFPLFEGQLGIQLLNAIISSEFVDIALALVHKHPKLALLKEKDGDSALSIISRTDSLFPRTETFSWWQKFIYHRIPLKKSTSEADAHTTFVAGDIENLSSAAAAHSFYSTSFHIISRDGQKLESMIWYLIENLVPKVKELRQKKATYHQSIQLVEYLCNKIVSSLPENEALAIFKESIMKATKYGISEIVEMIMHKYPLVTLHDVLPGKNVFLLAASYRFENVINLIHNMSDRRYMFFDSTDNGNNNLLHICAKLAPPHRLNLVAGAALQMQRELQWFREMEKFVSPSRKTWMNNEKKTPQMVFTEEHAKLKADGERWMKDTANACTIAAALIATVVFAAAFTVPRGVESVVVLFIVSDAVSLFSSITSLLMFLSILTARYAEEDFLYILPKRLSIGLLSLFVSITFMLLAFGATLYLVLRTHIAWFVALVAAFACLPLASFVLLQFPLLVDVVYSTYGPGIFGKKGDRILY